MPVPTPDAPYSIGQLAHRFGMRTSALRYYEEAGLLMPSKRVGGQRRYDEGSVARLRLIQLAQSTGFQLSEIRTLLAGDEEWRALTITKIAELKAKSQELKKMSRLLEGALECDCILPEACARIDPSNQDGLAITSAQK